MRQKTCYDFLHTDDFSPCTRFLIMNCCALVQCIDGSFLFQESRTQVHAPFWLQTFIYLCRFNGLLGWQENMQFFSASCTDLFSRWSTSTSAPSKEMDCLGNHCSNRTYSSAFSLFSLQRKTYEYYIESLVQPNIMKWRESNVFSELR